MSLSQFSPPAHLDDFDSISHQRDAWSEMISASFDGSITCIEIPSTCGRVGHGVGKGNSQFYNPTKTDVVDPVVTVDIMWLGFPRTLTITYGEELGLQKADDLHPLTDFLHGISTTDPAYAQLQQLFCRPGDEYCEWHVTRDPASGKLLRVAFTCEGPEYWSALASGYPSGPFYYSGPQTTGAVGDPNKLLALYQQLASPAVQMQDLFFQEDIPGYFLKGQYNPYNKWNTTDGVVHLTHPANTLLAEIQIAADGTVMRIKRTGRRLVQEADQMICCGAYGGVNRSSDPNIGNAVNQLARLGAMVTLNDPVGLYMDSLNTVGWTKPDGKTPVGNYWQIIRGQPGMVVRAVYEVPPEEGFTVSDILIGGTPLQYAGQIAREIKMKLTGAGFIPQQKKQPQYVPCLGRCYRNSQNSSQLLIVDIGKDSPPGYELDAPGINVPTPQVQAPQAGPPPALDLAESAAERPTTSKVGRRYY